MQTRRMFVQAGAAFALPVVGGVLLTRERGIVAAACTTCADDPVSAEAMRQFKAAIRALGKSAKGEHARQAAAALRVMAVNARARNLDAEFKRSAQREVSTYGRDNVLMRPFDREQFVATAREFGIVPAPELREIPLAERRQALDTLLSTGVTPHLDRAAAFFEAAGADIDRRGPVRHVQTKEEQIAICRNLQTYVSTAEGLAIIACVLWGPVACAYFSGAYLGAKLYYDTQTDCSRWLG
jgi:hypothetical protein